jgi:hypothetical protein
MPLLRSFAILAVLVWFTSGTAKVSAETEQSAPPKRPLGVPDDAQFFDGKWYRVYLGHVSWKIARDKCAVIGGRLATVTDEPTRVFLARMADHRLLWLGATDEKVKSLWIWTDGSQMQFQAWAENHPLNQRGYDYLYINHEGNWHDATEKDAGTVGFICEWWKK